jgi:hypothetical protein
VASRAPTWPSISVPEREPWRGRAAQWRAYEEALARIPPEDLVDRFGRPLPPGYCVARPLLLSQKTLEARPDIVAKVGLVSVAPGEDGWLRQLRFLGVEGPGG